MRPDEIDIEDLSEKLVAFMEREPPASKKNPLYQCLKPIGEALDNQYTIPRIAKFLRENSILKEEVAEDGKVTTLSEKAAIGRLTRFLNGIRSEAFLKQSRLSSQPNSQNEEYRLAIKILLGEQDADAISPSQLDKVVASLGAKPATRVARSDGFLVVKGSPDDPDAIAPAIKDMERPEGFKCVPRRNRTIEEWNETELKRLNGVKMPSSVSEVNFTIVP